MRLATSTTETLTDLTTDLVMANNNNIKQWGLMSTPTPVIAAHLGDRLFSKSACVNCSVYSIKL